MKEIKLNLLPRWVKEAIKILEDENPGCAVEVVNEGVAGYKFIVYKPGNRNKELGQVQYCFTRNNGST